MTEVVTVIGTWVIGLCTLALIGYCFNEAEKCYWIQYKQRMEREDEGCRAHGGFVFTSDKGRECVMGAR